MQQKPTSEKEEEAERGRGGGGGGEMEALTTINALHVSSFARLQFTQCVHGRVVSQLFAMCCHLVALLSRAVLSL